MVIRVDVIQMSTNVPECMSIQQLQQATAHDEYLQRLIGYIIAGRPESKDHLHKDIRAYWPFKYDMVVIDGVSMKGRCIIIPEVLESQALDQLYINHMGINKKKTPSMQMYTGLT